MRRILLTAMIVLGATLALGAAGYSTKVYLTDGGDTQTIASGGKIAVESGGVIDLASGSSLTGTVAIGGTGTFATGTGAVSLNGDVTIAAGKDLVFAKGAGYLEINGTTSGGIKIAPIGTGTALATIQNQNVAASTITLPAATCTLPGLGLANVWSSTNEFAGVTQTGASTFATGTGAVSLNGDVTVAAGKTLSLAKGAGYVEINGATSGGIKIAPIDTGTAVATIQNQNVAASTITLPAATCTLPGLGLANVWSSTNEFAGVTQTGASTFATGTGAVSLNGDVTVAAGKDLVLAKGAGYLELNAETSGSLKIIPAAATAEAVTLTTAAQTGGAGTLTIPNLLGATETIATVAGPDTFADSKLTSKLVKAVAIKAYGTVQFTGRPADAELLTIGGRKYEIDKNASFPDAGGDVKIDCNAAGSTDADVTAAALAINGDASATVTAVADTTNDLLHLYAKTAGAAGNTITLATTMTNTTVSEATLLDGADAAVKVHVCCRHVITANEATGGAAAALRFDTGLSAICSVQITYEDAGVNAAGDIVIDVAGGVVTLVEGAAPAWDAGDVINLVVIGLE